METTGDYVSAAVIVPTFNHILVFSTITYGLCRSRSQPSILDFRKGYQLYILGDTLPVFFQGSFAVESALLPVSS